MVRTSFISKEIQGLTISRIAWNGSLIRVLGECMHNGSIEPIRLSFAPRQFKALLDANGRAGQTLLKLIQENHLKTDGLPNQINLHHDLGGSIYLGGAAILFGENHHGLQAREIKPLSPLRKAHNLQVQKPILTAAVIW
jgi:hypothetical protein